MAGKPPPASMPPPSEPFPGSRTPGWNDPPPVQFSPSGSGTSSGKPKRINLNKRVAFPLQGTTGAAAPSTAQPKPTAVVPPNQNADLPPPPPMMPPSAGATVPPLPAVPPSAGCSQPVARVRPTHQANPEPEPQPQPNAEPAIPLGDPFQSLRTHFDQAEADAQIGSAETERERAVVGQLWETGILSDDTQAILIEIAHAMETKDYDTAKQLYAYLQANHGEEVSIFNSAMNHLVESPPTTERSLLLVTTIEEPMDIGGGDNPNT